jgi:hypothetical protein
MKKLPITRVYQNETKIIVVEPTNSDIVHDTWIFEKRSNGSLIPIAPEHHSTFTLEDFLSHYDAKPVDKRLVLAQL